MKCRQCGNSFHNGIICPLCGHKSIGKIHCAVCGKIIHYGQGHCSSCGTPTQYCKKGEVVVNGAIIDYTVHSEASHTYDQQEQYDYKKNAYQYDQVNKNKTGHPYKEQYDYKKDAYQYDSIEKKTKKDNLSSWFDIVMEKQEQMKYKRTNGNKSLSAIPGARGSMVIGIIAVILIIGFCMTVLLSQGTVDKPVSNTKVHANTSIENLPIVGVNTNLMQQANASIGQWSYLYENQLDIINNYESFVINRNFKQPVVANEAAEKYVYRNDTNYCYIGDFNTLYYQNLNTKENKIISEEVFNALYLDDSLYYQKYEEPNTIFQYSIVGEKTSVLTKEYTDNLRVDAKTNKLYYSDTEYQVVAVSNLNQEQRTYDKYDLLGYYFFVEENMLYDYSSSKGFSSYDLLTKKVINTIPCYGVFQYARVDDGYIYTLENGDLYKMLDDGTNNLIVKGFNKPISFQLVGDKILFKDEENMENSIYIANEDGDIAQIYF